MDNVVAGHAVDQIAAGTADNDIGIPCHLFRASIAVGRNELAAVQNIVAIAAVYVVGQETAKGTVVAAAQIGMYATGAVSKQHIIQVAAAHLRIKRSRGINQVVTVRRTGYVANRILRTFGGHIQINTQCG